MSDWLEQAVWTLAGFLLVGAGLAGLIRLFWR